MREALRNLVKQAICIKYTLPYNNIERSCFSQKDDFCLGNEDHNDISKIIYNGIIEHAVNEYHIDYDNLLLEQRKVITQKIRYNRDDSDDVKQKYGFYGEVLIDLILRCLFQTKVLLARGYLYSIVDNSEIKGFDAFHLMKNKNEVNELWLGEAKFYVDYKKPITDVLEKLNISFSKKYLNINLLAIIDNVNNLTTSSEEIDELVKEFNENPEINLGELVSNRKIKIVYPVMIAYKSHKDYNDSIKKCINHIKEKYISNPCLLSSEVEYSLFFIFFPLNEVSNIKKKVIEWIENHEPLI
ncbi:MAG: SAVED domain-containing protein [Alphaproteobacteria bacterium]|nr:SAVED domain-containing protein [Alphaproteobacteria bacterium]